MLRLMPANSVDALVTDPPYGWRFMGKAWDAPDIESKANARKAHPSQCPGAGPNGGHKSTAAESGKYDQSASANQSFQEWTEAWAREVYRVLKPGAHALIFCGPRTYHRMAAGVEDAGFEIRDQLQWLFGSGFPKSLDISKAIDKANGNEKNRPIKGPNPSLRPNAYVGQNGWQTPMRPEHKTSAATLESAAWEGWGTALKPANEPILLARKPLSEKTVAANVLKWGTGGLNIDGCRIGTDTVEKGRKGRKGNETGKHGIYNHGALPVDLGYAQGRFPANLILDETAAQLLDAQSGISKSTGGRTVKRSGKYEEGKISAPGEWSNDDPGFGDTGGASRFFYVAKTSTRERNEGLSSRKAKKVNDGRQTEIDNPFQRGETERLNTHPTVKPIKLMTYLCRLITPPNGVVLDPFMGSGSTGLAAIKEGFRFIGIEREPEYFAIAEARCKNLNRS